MEMQSSVFKLVDEKKYLLPFDSKHVGVDIDNMPFREAIDIVSAVVRIQLTSFQANGFVLDREGDCFILQPFSGVAGKGIKDIPNPSVFEKLLSTIDEGDFSDSLFQKTRFVLNRFLSEDLKRRGFTGTGASSNFTMSSTDQKINIALVSIPEYKSQIFTIPRDEMPVSNTGRDAMGNVIMTTENDVDLGNFLLKYGHKGLYAIFFILFSPQITKIDGNDSVLVRQQFMPWVSDARAPKTDLIYARVSAGDLDKIKIKELPKMVSIFNTPPNK